METGDIIFVRNNSIISKIIRFFDKGRFSHCAIAISKDRLIEAQYNIKVSESKNTYPNYEVLKMNMTDKQKKDLLVAIKKYKGKRYDYLLAFSMSTKWLRIDNDDYLICSELVEDVLKDIGILDPYLQDMKPNELYRYLKNMKNL